MFWRQTGPTESQNLEGILHRVHQQITPAVSSYQIQFCCLSGRYPSMQQLQHNGVYLQTGSETASLSSWCHEEENSQTSLNFQSKWSLMWAECSLLIGWILSAASLAAVSGPDHILLLRHDDHPTLHLTSHDSSSELLIPISSKSARQQDRSDRSFHRTGKTQTETCEQTISALVLVQRVSYFHHNHNQNQRAELRFDFKYCWY